MSKLSIQLDRRQKIALLLTLIALAFLGWEVVGLIRGDVASPPKATKPAATTKATAATSDQHHTPKPAQLPQSAPSTSSVTSTQNQQQYLNISSQYELAKLQRRLLEEQVAISAARNRIADTEQRTSQINSANSENNANASSALYLSAPYRLSFLSHQGGRWTATIVIAGQFQAVSVGQVLADGSKVIAIDENGVLLEKNKQKQLLTFTGVENQVTDITS